MRDSALNHVPFVYEFATPVAIDDLEGQYDQEMDMWLIVRDGVRVPIIIAEPYRSATETITRTNTEEDDRD